ncbi:hypothetical protein FQN55_002602 [Onygenales sp. PD_40]|nr:hypothetical protein FQN55_002602 [Onygenales sp. PD_40]
MSSSVSTLQLKFLKNSAHYLAAQSPSTSAHLLSVHNHLLWEESKPLSVAQHREFCGACGGVRLPETTKTINVKKDRVKKRVRSTASAEPAPAVVYRCLRCRRQKFQTLQKTTKNTDPKRPRILATTAPTASESIQLSSAKDERSAESTATTSQKATSENISSKKRAKARKQQGLMAALAAGKQRAQSQASPSSLDLLDFLQH